MSWLVSSGIYWFSASDFRTKQLSRS